MKHIYFSHGEKILKVKNPRYGTVTDNIPTGPPRERTFAIVLEMYCYYKYSVALPHGAMGWTLQCVIAVFPDHTHVLLIACIKA